MFFSSFFCASQRNRKKNKKKLLEHCNRSSTDHAAHSNSNCCSIIPTFLMQFLRRPMLHNSVRNAQYLHLCIIVMRRHKLKNGAAESAGNSSVFNRNDLLIPAEHFM